MRELTRGEQASKVTIKRIERNKRKFITGVHGLEAFGASSPRCAAWARS